ncbi:MAG: nucleotidyltransferase substrate binding protein [Firmicutes bacterium]|nr:nucleotidyltransferase substrate binding protein [Bacillota bacterium]MBQ9604642.1 nucleotidyltransferase substrate binding protein [Bacillota bacterium]
MRKCSDFIKAYDNLAKIFDYSEPYDDVIITGITGMFGLCFELAWKAMKEILEDEGLTEQKTGSPKLILKAAYQQGIIFDEELWLNALRARNNAAHIYNKDAAVETVKSIKTEFYTMFGALKEYIVKMEYNE